MFLNLFSFLASGTVSFDNHYSFVSYPIPDCYTPDLRFVSIFMGWGGEGAAGDGSVQSRFVGREGIIKLATSLIEWQG
jgi:hypothetical protein